MCAAGATPVPPALSGAAGRSQEERGACRGDGLLGLFKATATKSSLRALLGRCLHTGKGWLCRAGSSRGPEASAPAVGVSRPRRDCENNSWAGHCGCILLLPRSPCLLAFVWVSSCSDLPLSVLLALVLQSQHFCARG